MKSDLDFDVETIRKNEISLLDCQIDLILKSLEFYVYTYKFVYPRKKSLTDEENLRISLVRDTWNQIFDQYRDSKIKQPIIVPNIDDEELLHKKIVSF